MLLKPKMPTKPEIREALFQGIRNSGGIPSHPEGEKYNGGFTLEGAKYNYYLILLSRAAMDAKKREGENWGESGRTGAVYRDYSPEQTKGILLQLKLYLETPSASNYKNAGLSKEAIDNAERILISPDNEL